MLAYIDYLRKDGGQEDDLGNGCLCGGDNSVVFHCVLFGAI